MNCKSILILIVLQCGIAPLNAFQPAFHNTHPKSVTSQESDHSSDFICNTHSQESNSTDRDLSHSEDNLFEHESYYQTTENISDDGSRTNVFVPYLCFQCTLNQKLLADALAEFHDKFK